MTSEVGCRGLVSVVGCVVVEAADATHLALTPRLSRGSLVKFGPLGPLTAHGLSQGHMALLLFLCKEVCTAVCTICMSSSCPVVLGQQRGSVCWLLWLADVPACGDADDET